MVTPGATFRPMRKSKDKNGRKRVSWKLPPDLIRLVKLKALERDIPADLMAEALLKDSLRRANRREEQQSDGN